MLLSKYFRLPIGVLVLLCLCTQAFNPPKVESQIVESLRSSITSYMELVQGTMNETMRKMMETLDSDGDGLIQLSEFRNHANIALQKIRALTPSPQDVGIALSHFTWTELMWRYVLFQFLFLALLFVVENIRDFFFPGPRRVLLDDSYLTSSPLEVGPEIALMYDTPWTLYEKMKVFFFAVTGLLFLRITLLFFFAIASMVMVSLSGYQGRNRYKNPVWFSICAFFASVFSILGCICVGIYNVKIFGQLADGSQCKILIGNHSCIMEVVILYMLGKFPSFVTRKENCEKVPFFAGVANVSEAISLDRHTAESRQRTANAIMERAKDKSAKKPQLMIFPEGTTTNQRALFMFKKGAMEPGEPIQMICVSFPYKHFNPCWTGRACGGNNISDLLLRSCSQFVTRVEVRLLPVYTPTDEEKRDATIYAKHCQKMMATVLGCHVSSCTYADYIALARKEHPRQISSLHSETQ